jgi:hypothetical protein
LRVAQESVVLNPCSCLRHFAFPLPLNLRPLL